MIVAAESRRRNARHRSSPRARRLLREAGLAEPEAVGSGPEGRILAADVESFIASAAQNAIVPDRGDDSSGPDRVDRPATTAAVFMAVEVDFFRIDRVRQSAAEPLGYLPFVARAVVDALAAFPYLNAQVGERTVHVTSPVHLGITVDSAAGGPLTPVVRDADSLRLASLAQRIATLTDRARADDLKPADAEGATFTISDSGPHGTMLTAPVLGSAQVAALALGAVRAKPVAVERDPGEYAVAVHPVGTLGLSFDQHTIDTGHAAGFLDRVRDALETRDWSTEL
jgi:pyruvate/2-oxoglutarate dehydrogenase complex dihydrolipoamide acyltransferase (E2) component